MVAFYIVLVLGTLVGAAYLTLAFQEFKRSRDAQPVVQDESPEAFDQQGRGFSWVAGAGVVVSTTLLVLVSVDGVFWYLLPLLGVGSALAVVVAFLADRSEASASPSERAAGSGVAR